MPGKIGYFPEILSALAFFVLLKGEGWYTIAMKTVVLEVSLVYKVAISECQLSPTVHLAVLSFWDQLTTIYCRVVQRAYHCLAFIGLREVS